MRTLAVFILCGLVKSVSAQVDKAEVKIVKIQRFEYAFNESRCELENDTIAVDSVIAYARELVYPMAKTANKALEKFLNDKILEVANIDETKTTSQKLTSEYKCMDDNPSESYVNYKVNSSSSRYLSMTITSDDYAGGGGNGASHYAVALTFDLNKRKTLVMGDLIQEQYDSAVYDIAISQIKSSHSRLFEAYAKDHNPNLFQFTSTLDIPVAINNDGITFYWPISWGGRSTSEEVNIYFEKHSHLFVKDFIKTLHTKK